MSSVSTDTTPSRHAPAASVGAVVEARDIVQEFAVRGRTGLRGMVRAVSGVSFEVRRQETLGVVGETGSGKSTLARAIIQSPRPKSGSVLIDGVDVTKLRAAEVREARRKVQMVYQDPFGSLDPKWRVARIVMEPLNAYKVRSRAWRQARVDEVLELVGLDPTIYRSRHPRELSGGQCQRVAIARALANSPSLIICDEAVSSLDVLIQAQVLDLFAQLREELGLSYFFIAHDLALVNEVSDRIAVMYLGRLCEVGPATSLYRSPRHPYSQALLDSIPSAEPGAPRSGLQHAIQGDPPSPLRPPSGCRFRTRCPRADTVCARETPEMRQVADDHYVACHFPLAVDTVATPAGGGREACASPRVSTT